MPLADRVKDTTTTTGTGVLTLAGAAPAGFRTFASAFSVGTSAIAYAIADASNWEIGLGTLSAATGLTRDVVLSSSNAGALVDFPAGSKDVFCTAAAVQVAGGRHMALPANDIAVGAAAVYSKTITGATTLTVSNVPPAGQVGQFDLELTNGGAFAVTWWSGIKWPKGAAPSLTASGLDVLTFYTRDGGATWRGGRAIEDSK
jgi:hypothetical protein